MAQNINLKHQEELNWMEQFAVWITDWIGTMGFFILIFLWTIFWLGWNTLGPEETRFDPFPAFVLWLFISNLLQLFLLPLIMISQNLEERHAELRAENDYEVNLKSEKEIQEIKEELTKQTKILEELKKK